MNFQINKELNKFIFLAEIANLRNNPWNKERKAFWLKTSGGRLSIQESSAVKEFSGLFSNSNFNLIQAYFVSLEGNKINKRLKQELGLNQTKNLERILHIFTPRFNLFWKKEKAKLALIKKYLNFQKRNIDQGLLIVNNLTGKKEKVSLKPTAINLTISSDQSKDQIGWFSIWDNHCDLVLECSSNPEKNWLFLNLIIIHEYFHLAIRKNSKLKNQITEFSNKHKNILKPFYPELEASQILEELLISSFVPEGYLASMIFGQNIKPAKKISVNNGLISFVSLRQFCAYKMLEISKEYIDSKKSLDEDYLKRLIAIIKSG